MGKGGMVLLKQVLVWIVIDDCKQELVCFSQQQKLRCSKRVLFKVNTNHRIKWLNPLPLRYRPSRGGFLPGFASLLRRLSLFLYTSRITPWNKYQIQYTLFPIVSKRIFEFESLFTGSVIRLKKVYCIKKCILSSVLVLGVCVCNISPSLVFPEG